MTLQAAAARIRGGGGGGGGEPDFGVGFRFRPTDVELVDFYLRRRTQGDLTTPTSFIRELDIYKSQPWHLPHHLFPYCNAEEKEMYFFTRRRRAGSNGSKRFSRRVDEGGLWAGQAAGKPIYKTEQAGDSKERIKIGHRAQLAFKSFDDPNDKKSKRSTPWILHEYRLVDDTADDVVLCRIHKRKGKGEEEEEEGERLQALVISTQQWADEQTSLPALQPSMEVDAVAAAADGVVDDDLSFAQLLEGELMEEEQRRAKRQRIGGGGGEEVAAHQASTVDTDDGLTLTLTLDEISRILDEFP